MKKRPKTDDAFYRFILRELLSRNDNLKSAKIFLDGSAGQNYRNRTASYLRRQLNKSDQKMSEFKFVNSKTDTLIQLADIIAGSIRRKYDTKKTDHADYHEVIKSKIEDIWEYK